MTVSRLEATRAVVRLTMDSKIFVLGLNPDGGTIFNAISLLHLAMLLIPQ